MRGKFLFIIFLFGIFLVINLKLRDRLLGVSNEETQIILAGDVMLGRSVMTKSLGLGDPRYPFRKVADKLKVADLVFVNLENPIVTGCPKISTGMKFCTDPELVEGLTFAGVDIVNIANNHTRNYGQAGFEETKKVLEQNGIDYVGDDNLGIKQFNNLKFGFLGFDFVSKPPNDADFMLIRDADKKVDVLIVSVHWGVEYKDKAASSQRQIAKKIIEAGADVIAGHHPHWVQDVEYLDPPDGPPAGEAGWKRPVYYSLGNFVFDQMWSEKTRSGLVVSLTFRNRELISENRHPIYMSSWAQPEFVTVDKEK